MALNGGIALDISRLLTGLRFPQPTGIERIELGLAEHLSSDSGGIALTPAGACGFTAAGRSQVAAIAKEHWEPTGRSVEQELAPIRRFLRGEAQGPERTRKGRWVPLSILPILAGAAFRSPGPVVRQGGVYLHANFFRLEQPGYFEWLARRPDIRPAFLLYDLLPIQHPQFFRRGEDQLHARRIASAARLGRTLITSARSVAADLRQYLKRLGLPIPPIQSIGLPVDAAFDGAMPRSEGLDAAPYFVVCGTIEPRKNHRLLIDVWKRLASAGAHPPKLIIAGRRGWNNQDVFDQLDALGPLANLVLEAPSLSTAAMARLMASSRGVLSPSFAEGYGLPVAEALALNVPVIASDNSVYRELWSGHATLIDPSDCNLWTDAISAAAEASPTRGLNQRPPHVMDWAKHVQLMEAVLDAS